MKGKYFLDTNILVYTFDQSQLQKQEISRNLVKNALNNQSGCISYQVIQEFLNIASRKFANPLSVESKILYTEDLQHNQKIEDMIIVNPFL